MGGRAGGVHRHCARGASTFRACALREHEVNFVCPSSHSKRLHHRFLVCHAKLATTAANSTGSTGLDTCIWNPADRARIRSSPRA